MKSKIKALVLDVGGVLFLPKNNEKEKHLLSSFGEACLLLKNFDIDASDVQKTLYNIYKQSSKGSISKKETSDLMSKELNISSKRLNELFEKVYRNNTIENKKLYNYLLRLKKKGYKIGILSTQFHLSKDVLIPKKYYKNFDALEISCDDKLRKPDKKAFKLILKRLKINPKESIFVDDKQENLDAAKNLGMETAIFKNNNQFFLNLENLGIK